MCICFSKGTNVSLGIFFVAFLEHFDRGAGETSWIPSMAAWMSWMIAPLASALATKYGHRKIVAAGSVICFVSVLMSSFSRSMWQLIATVGFLNGIGYGLIHSPATSFVGFYFKRRQAIATGLAYTGIGFGSMALPPLFQYWISLYGWNGALLLFAGLSANLCVAASLMRPVESKKVGEHNSENVQVQFDASSGKVISDTLLMKEAPIANLEEFDDYIEQEIPAHSVKLSRSRCSRVVRFFGCDYLVKNFYYMSFLMAFAIFSVGQIISVVHLAPRIVSVGQSKERTALLLSLYGASNIVGAPAWGFLVSHSKRIRDNVDIFMAFAYVMYGVTVLLAPLATNTVSITFLVIALGFERGSFSAQTVVLVRKAVGNELFTIAHGWSLLSASFGQLIGAPISGYIVDSTGSYAYSFYLAGLLIVGSGFLLFAASAFVRRQLKRTSTGG
ncbi:monocarboxylate transporter 13-like [Ptychodera flava]|uniref:monocarboxylate transporter 13-like n=1 Tax=Ptychodera flava TaxID=63121 RepID=UPI00396A1B36